MAGKPIAYKQYYVWAEQEADGYRSYVGRQDGRPVATGPSGAAPASGPIPSPDVFDSEDQALDHARSMADRLEA